MSVNSKNPKKQKKSPSDRKRVQYEKMLNLMRSRGGFGQIKDLAEKLRISQQTIRRNFDFLKGHGNEVDVFDKNEKLIQIPAGSVMLSRAEKKFIKINDIGQVYSEGIAIFIEEVILKNKITNENQLIIMDASDLCFQVAQQLPKDIRVKILTNSPFIAVALRDHQYVQIKVIGGSLLNGSLIPTGDEIFGELENTYAELCILGDCKVQAEKGVAVADENSAKLKRAMVNCSRSIAVLASKENTESFESNIIVNLKQLNYLYLDGEFTEDELNSFKKGSLKLYVRTDTK